MSKKHFEKEKNFISIVVYMKNSETFLEKFLYELDVVLNEKFQSYEYILVDDSSEDRSVAKVKELSEGLNGNVSVVKLAWNHGLDKAMIAGEDIAIGDFVFEFDSVFVNYDMNLVMDVYYKALQGHDIVAVSESANKKVSSTLFYRLLKRVSYRKMELTTEVFRIVSRRAINRISKDKAKVKYRKAINHYSGFDTEVLYYEPINQQKVENDLRLSEKVDLGWDVLISYSNIGTKIAGIISGIFLFFATASLVYTVVSYITIEGIEPGWTTTMLFLSISFTGVFFILFIISKYLTNILIEVQDQPLYIFKSLEKISKK